MSRRPKGETMKGKQARFVCVVCLAAGLLAVNLGAGQPADEAADEALQYWPQWRGPFGNGVATTDGPLHFGATENVKWKIEIPGRGISTPIVWGDRLFLTTAIPVEQDGQSPRRGTSLVSQRFDVICIDRRTGELLWQQTAKEAMPHEGYHRSLGSYANASPVTDGEHVYVFFGSFGLYSFDMDGNLEWSRDFGVQMRMFNRFGEASSPALHGNTVVVLFDHEGQSFIEAVDKRSGKTLWKNLRDENTTWASPYILVHEGRAEVVVSGGNFIKSYDLETGVEIWRCAGMSRHPIPTPVAGQGLLFAASGTSERRVRVIRLGETGDLTDTDAVVWKLDRAAPYNPSPLLWGDELYLVRDGGLVRGTSRFSAFDVKTGSEHYMQMRLPSSYTVKASPVGAGDKIYLLTEEGDVLVIKRGTEFEVLAVNSMDEMFLASPVIVDGVMFLRGAEHLFAISES